MDDRLEACIRTQARRLADDAVIDPSVPLVDIGIDSLGTIQLLVDVEQRFDIVFPDEMLTPEVFATPASLWETISQLMPHDSNGSSAASTDREETDGELAVHADVRRC